MATKTMNQIQPLPDFFFAGRCGAEVRAACAACAAWPVRCGAAGRGAGPMFDGSVTRPSRVCVAGATGGALTARVCADIDTGTGGIPPARTLAAAVASSPPSA